MSTLKVSSFGAYLTSWKIKNREVLYQGSQLKRTGIPLLFPNFDAGEPLPNHGFARLSQWQVIKSTPNFSHLKLTNQDIKPEFQKIYNYQFSVDQIIESHDNQLDYFLEIKNLGHQNLPISPALHPYWPVDHFQKNHIKLVDFPDFDPSRIDWENNPPDHLYNLSQDFVANFPDYQLTIREIGESKYFSYLQVWSQNSSFPDYNFVCFEPATCPPTPLTTSRF